MTLDTAPPSMNADQERAFSEQSDAVGRALWPGRVRIDGETYACSLTKTTLELEDQATGGVREAEGIRVEISKCDLAECPAQETIVKDLSDDRLYRVRRTDGRMDSDTSWFLTCERHT